MDQVRNIYGPLDQHARIIIGANGGNEITSILSARPDNTLLLESIADVNIYTIPELVVESESDGTFSLRIDETGLYIGVNTLAVNSLGVAPAYIRAEKTIFKIGWSLIDATPRSTLMAGTPYIFQTTFAGRTYTVGWAQSENWVDVISIIPTSWYDHTCQRREGLESTIHGLKSLYFKGYTNDYWCSHHDTVTNCDLTTRCGSCLGRCQHKAEVCYNTPEGQFGCGIEAPLVTAETETIEALEVQTPPPTTGDVATWVAVFLVLIIVGLLAYGLSRVGPT